MVEAVSRLRFSWDSTFTACRASAYDANGNLLGQLVLEVPAETKKLIWMQRGPVAHLRIEELAEKHLRAMLELRY
jgi:hypothetical protein